MDVVICHNPALDEVHLPASLTLKIGLEFCQQLQIVGEKDRRETE